LSLLKALFRRSILDPHVDLSRRERQIMNVIYSSSQATATQAHELLTDAPTRTAVRTTLGILVRKGWLKYSKEGREFVYSATRSGNSEARKALQSLLSTFFGGSIEEAFASHLANPKTKVSEEELAGLEDLIRKARRRETK
jgi:BlaI family transcriptional regulator, penicillinase repressor